MEKVAAYMNSPVFNAPGGRGLAGLTSVLRRRCTLVVEHSGQRVPT